MMRPLSRMPASTGSRWFMVVAGLFFFMLSPLMIPGGHGGSMAGPAQRSAIPRDPRANNVPQSAADPIRIGIVTKEPDGASCSLQLPADYKKQNDRNVFNGSYENSSEDCACAFMNIDGRDIRLTRVYSKWSPGGDNKVGNRGVQVYTSRQTRVEVNYVVTHVCGPRDGEDCEVTLFSATIKVTRRGLSTTLSVRGVCGV